MNYASLEKRLKAFGIDLFMIVIIQGLLAQELLGLEGEDWEYSAILMTNLTL